MMRRKQPTTIAENSNDSMLEGKVSATHQIPLYKEMSTMPFSHLASNHLVIIPLQCLAEAEGKEEGKQQMKRNVKGDSM